MAESDSDQGGRDEDRIVELERRFEALLDEQERLRERVAVLESTALAGAADRDGSEVARAGDGAVGETATGAAAPAVTPADAEPAAATVAETEPAAATASANQIDVAEILTAVGRSLLVLSGAFLLRALTEHGTLSPLVGVCAGLLYAGIGLVLADRAGSRGKLLDASFHGLTSAAIGFPLIWEATLSFRVFGAVASALMLMVMGGAAIGVAWRRSLRPMMWGTTLLAAGSGAVLLFRTHEVAPFLIQILATSGATLWICYHRDWPALPFVSAVVTDLTVNALTMTATQHRPPEWLLPGWVLTAQIALLALYLGSFWVRHVVRGHRASMFDAWQLVLVFLVGYGGAVYLTEGAAADLALGGAALAVSGFSYAVCAFVIAPRQGRRRNYILHSSVGAMAGFEALRQLAPAAVAAPVVAVAAVGAALLGRRASTAIYRVHAALFALAAILVSGLVGFAIAAFTAKPSDDWPGFSPSMAVTLLLGGVVYLALRYNRSAVIPRWAGAGWELCVLAAVTLCAGAVAIALIGRPLIDVEQAADPSGPLAVVRTALLAAIAALLAGLARAPGRRELRHLSYPLIGLGVLELFAQQIPRRSALIIFLSLLFLGGALVISARTSVSARAARDSTR